MHDCTTTNIVDVARGISVQESGACVVCDISITRGIVSLVQINFGHNSAPTVPNYASKFRLSGGFYVGVLHLGLNASFDLGPYFDRGTLNPTGKPCVNSIRSKSPVHPCQT